MLVVAAHPDDEVLGCGGTIIKHCKRGDEVHVMIMAEGVTSRTNEHSIKSNEKALERLHANAFQASKIMGVSSVNLALFPDNRMDSVNLLDVIKKIEDEVEDFGPDIVYTHHMGDVNIDHRITHEAVVTACRPMPGKTVRKMLFFETLSSTEWQMSVTNKVFLPNFFVDVEIEFEQKIEALKCYESEMRLYPHSRSYDAVKILSCFRGFSVGKKCVEAFEVGREIID